MQVQAENLIMMPCKTPCQLDPVGSFSFCLDICQETRQKKILSSDLLPYRVGQ